MCCLTFPVKVNDYYRKKVVINSREELNEFHKKDSQTQADVWAKRVGHPIAPDDFFQWIQKRGVCPYGIISSNTKYWLELMNMYDCESGLSTPLPYNELPALFFEALRIYRENRPVDIPKEPSNGSKNN